MKKAFLKEVLWPIFLGILIVGSQPVSSYARDLCRAQVDCPIDFDKDTAYVGYDVAVLSEKFEHCSPKYIKENTMDTVHDTISLFMIIDHTISMAVRDPKSIRFRAACRLIDSIAKKSPKSEIGIAVFSNRLMHNYKKDSLFRQLPNNYDWNDSYVPFITLDSTVQGKSAAEKLKWAIQVDSLNLDMGKNYTLVNGDYGPSGRTAHNGAIGSYMGTTDVSLPFEAAKEAFKTAKYAKNRQFIVFFSDGEAQFVDKERLPFINDYLAGKDLPTTFTAFFVTVGERVPPEIKQMTANIRINGYSLKNPLSDVWKTEGVEQEFFGKIFTSIIGDGLKIVPSRPVQLIINNDTAIAFDSIYAYFKSPFIPLPAYSPATLNISYTWHYLDPLNKDSANSYKVIVARGPRPDFPSIDCWNQGSLAFYYNSQKLAYFARPNQLLLEIQYTAPDSGNFPPHPNTVDVTIKNKDNSDSLVLTLIKKEIPGRVYYTSTFMREYQSPSIPGDTILQNNASKDDSIIAVYRNPVYQIDTLRHGIKSLREIDLKVENAFYKDRDADGYPDVIGVKQVGKQILTWGECDTIRTDCKILSRRYTLGATYADTVAPCSYGFQIVMQEPSATQELFTNVYRENGAIDEHIKIPEIVFTSGQLFPYTYEEIQDSMAPVIVKATFCPAYYKKGATAVPETLEVVFSESVKTPLDKIPFSFFKFDKKIEYTMELEPMANVEATVLRFYILRKKEWPQPFDSIHIIPSKVSDISANIQDNIRNRWAPLEVKPTNFDIEITVVPNPVNIIGKNIINGSFDQNATIKVKVILGPNTIIYLKKGQLNIYDPVGNLVISLDGSLVDDDKNGIFETFVFKWDGKSSYGKTVGGSAYVCIATIENDQGIKRSIKAMIGVQSDNVRTNE